MKKVKELLAKLKQRLLGVLDQLKLVFGITLPEEKGETVDKDYHYTVTAINEDDQDCCQEHEGSVDSLVFDVYGRGLEDGLEASYAQDDEDFDGVKEVLKPVRKTRKKASKKKLTKKKKPTKKNK